jgi:hypothetical protein
MDAKNLSNVLTELSNRWSQERSDMNSFLRTFVKVDCAPSNRYEQDEGTQKLVELALTLWTARKIEEQEPNDKRLNNLRSMQVSPPVRIHDNCARDPT